MRICSPPPTSPNTPHGVSRDYTRELPLEINSKDILSKVFRGMVTSFSVFWRNVLYITFILSCLLQVGAVVSAERDSHPFVTVISGLRVEPKEPNHDNPILGYDNTTSIIKPDTEVRVVIYGYGLENLGNISFVPSRMPTADCNHAPHTIIGNHKNSFIWTNERFVVILAFPQIEPLEKFHICYSTGTDSTYRYLDNIHTLITTNAPPRVYYFPMYIQIIIIIFLLILSGLFSGLNLGLMALNPQELMLIIKSGSKTERRYAELVLPVRESGNLLLCSLLIGNVLVNSGISILLDDMTSGYVALIGASAGIVVFGEIFPQSLCVKKGLAVGARTIKITRFFMLITWPVAYPISKLLDCILGEEIQSYDRKRLLELIKMNSSGALQEELKIAVGAMEIIDKTVSSIMTPINDVFMLPNNTILNIKTCMDIVNFGYTRIPVHIAGDRNQVVSLLFVKDLTLIDPDDNFMIKTVCNFHNHPLRFVMEDTPLRVMLDEFKRGDYHLAMVQRIIEHEDKDPTYELVGIVTLEDIVEEIIQDEIVDETDGVTDNVNRRKTNRRTHSRHPLGLYTENPEAVVGVQMQMVTFQWLRGNLRAFHENFVVSHVLEKLIRQNCRRVGLSHLQLDTFAPGGLPRNAKLYTKGEYSEKFILILEGRCIVTIGQDQMTFEAGPWHVFGTEMLQAILNRCENSGNTERDDASPSKSSLNQGAEKKLGFIPDYSVVVHNECTYLEVTAPNWLLAYKTTMISRGGVKWPSAPMLHESGIHRCATDGGALLHYDDQESMSKRPLTPDFTVQSVDEEEEYLAQMLIHQDTCTESEVSEEKDGSIEEIPPKEDEDQPLLPAFIDVEHGSPLGARSSSRTSLDERKTFVVHPQLEAVRRNGKNRSASESEHIELLPRENGSPLSDRSVLSHS